MNMILFKEIVKHDSVFKSKFFQEDFLKNILIIDDVCMIKHIAYHIFQKEQLLKNQLTKIFSLFRERSLQRHAERQILKSINHHIVITALFQMILTIFYSQHDSLSYQSWWLREILSSLNHQWLARSSTFNQLIISLELLVNAFWWRTFADKDYRVNWDQFNDLKISEKDEDLTQQMKSKILRVETAQSFSCQHLFSFESTYAHWLSHIL